MTGAEVDAAVEHDGELLADVRPRELVEAPPPSLVRRKPTTLARRARPSRDARSRATRRSSLLGADDVARTAVAIRQQRRPRRQQSRCARGPGRRSARRIAAAPAIALHRHPPRHRRIVRRCRNSRSAGLADQLLRLRRVARCPELQRRSSASPCRRDGTALGDAQLIHAVPDHLDRLIDRLGDGHAGGS